MTPATKALIIHTGDGSAQPAIVRTWVHIDARSKNDIVNIQLWLGSETYKHSSIKPLGDDWSTHFSQAFRAPGSSSHRFKLAQDNQKCCLEWRSSQPEVSKHDCELVRESGSEQQNTQQLLQDKIGTLCFNEKPRATMPAFDSSCLKLLMECKEAAHDRQAVVESCAKLLKSRTDRIHSLQQKLRERSPARSGASESHDQLKGAPRPSYLQP